MSTTQVISRMPDFKVGGRPRTFKLDVIPGSAEGRNPESMGQYLCLDSGFARVARAPE